MFNDTDYMKLFKEWFYKLSLVKINKMKILKNEIILFKISHSLNFIFNLFIFFKTFWKIQSVFLVLKDICGSIYIEISPFYKL